MKLFVILTVTCLLAAFSPTPVSAQSPDIVGWRCNYRGHVHSSPSECEHPEMGGDFIFEGEANQGDDLSKSAVKEARKELIEKIVSKLVTEEVGSVVGFLLESTEVADATISGPLKKTVAKYRAAKSEAAACATVLTNLEANAKDSATSAESNPDSLKLREKARFDSDMVALASSRFRAAVYRKEQLEIPAQKAAEELKSFSR